MVSLIEARICPRRVIPLCTKDNAFKNCLHKIDFLFNVAVRHFLTAVLRTKISDKLNLSKVRSIFNRSPDISGKGRAMGFCTYRYVLFLGFIKDRFME